jgi:hypothetical protein
MPAQVLELKPAVPAATVLKRVQSLKVPAWSVVVLVTMAGVYGYFAGRQNPLHHYVPYVGYPLVLDTTTGKACYSSAPKPSDDSAALAGPVGDSAATPAESAATTGPAIPLCGK